MKLPTKFTQNGNLLAVIESSAHAKMVHQDALGVMAAEVWMVWIWEGRMRFARIKTKEKGVDFAGYLHPESIPASSVDFGKDDNG